MPADKPVADEGTRCACPVRCKFCGARLKHDEHGPYCNTTNCQWSLNQGNPPSCVGAPAPAAKPVAERCPRCFYAEDGTTLSICPACLVAPSPATREHAAEGEWWQHFNDRVRGRVEGEYGPFTNADWQAACAAEREIAALRARISGLERVIEEAPHDWACHTQTAPVSGDCDCWKSEAKVSG